MGLDVGTSSTHLMHDGPRCECKEEGRKGRKKEVSLEEVGERRGGTGLSGISFHVAPRHGPLSALPLSVDSSLKGASTYLDLSTTSQLSRYKDSKKERKERTPLLKGRQLREPLATNLQSAVPLSSSGHPSQSGIKEG